LVYAAETGWSGVLGVGGLSLIPVEGDGERKEDEVDDGGGERFSGIWFLVMALRSACGGAIPENTWVGMRKGRTIS
jgi:hypothetical protein